ncbi:hypothetical protein CR205_11420 [Alteribacter lacisalsi]|uniref:Uncharacterized protein n=1 Tax=Alteribacter lacisalsi TaxID=2045244 RepID=A0A2W0HHC6_9BACI|nr:hypothetical protein [Alteribacter lacisalsi]PYZ96332.1 hypothetical protein CR205_11420 [Alteribacter lacisalsi]
MGIVEALWPLVVMGAVVVFVILRLKQKQEQGTMGKMKSKEAQAWLDSSIPLGMIAGSLLGLVAGVMLPFSLLTAWVVGTAAGYLGGYFVYEYFSRKKSSEQF